MNTGTQAIRQKWIKKGLIYKPGGQYWWRSLVRLGSHGRYNGREGLANLLRNAR